MFTLFSEDGRLTPLLAPVSLVDDFMQKINDEEGDAFPFEKARIVCGGFPSAYSVCPIRYFVAHSYTLSALQRLNY